MRLALFLVPLLMLAGCGGGNGGEIAADATGTPAAPVAAVAPPAGKQWTDIVAKTPEGGYLMGNPDAPIKLLEYGSRSCPVCGRFSVEAMEPLKEKYIKTGKVSLEFRDFPVHPQDPGITLLGRCVDKDRYFPILEAMFAAQPEIFERQQKIPEAAYAQLEGLPRPKQAAALADMLGYVDFMKQRGVPEAKARQCLNDPKMLEELTGEMKATAERGVNGTPTFYINGRQVKDVVSWSQLEPVLKGAGA
ncbi:MAG: thioredoxin domain-containing protein [Pseudomonadota bacterium]